ncbi:hypothetical protein ACLOJK_001108 [Asimina triloba]
MMDLSYTDVETATKGFSLEAMIGKGSHGCVYKGVLNGCKLIAVKKPTSIGGVQDNSKLDSEIEILSSIHSPHIVNLLGVVGGQDSGPKLLVMELMPNGSLEDLLHNVPRPPTWTRRLIMALQIARAVRALHEATSAAIIHRDIKSANVLLDSKRNARLADFSLAVRDHRLHVPAGTIGYLDPCYTTPGRLSTKIDVFSYGVVLLEIISGRRAMNVGLHPASLVEWALPFMSQDRMLEICDARETLPENMECAVRCMIDVAALCVSAKEERRPSMAEIVKELESAVSHCQFSVWKLLRSSFMGRRCSFLSPKGKQTRTIVCKIDEASE